MFFFILYNGLFYHKVILKYSGSGTALEIEIAGTNTQIPDAIQDTKARIVHLHVACTEQEFKVRFSNLYHILR